MKALLFIAAVGALVAQEPKRRSLVINGGCSPTSSFSCYERDLKAFASLFGGDTRYLSGGGQGSLRVQLTEGGTKRDELGRPVLEPVGIPGAGPATIENVRGELRRLKDENPSEISIYYGDHGGPKGPWLWDRTPFSGKEINEWLRSLPESTVVRSVHSHCYAGAALVDVERVLPSGRKNLPEYVNRNYPKNKCGLAVGRHDELSDRMTGSEDEGKGGWEIFFKKNPKASLSDTQRHLFGYSGMVNYPLLTSDYLVEDLAKVFCKEGRKPTGHEETAVRGELRKAVEAAKANPCSGEIDRELERWTKTIADGAKRYSQIGNARKNLAIQFLKEKFPERDAKYLEVQAEIEKAKAERAAALTGTPSWDSFLDAVKAILKRADLEKGEWLEYLRLIEGVDDGESYRNEFLKWIASDAGKAAQSTKEFKDRYPFYLESRDAPENKDRNIFSLHSHETNVTDRLQNERKQVMPALLDARRAFVEGILKEEGLEHTKAFYDSIVSCERTPMAGG